MAAVSLGIPLFYRFLGFDREGFTNSTHIAQQRLSRLRNNLSLDTQAEIQRQNTANRQVEELAFSVSLSVPRTLRFPASADEQQFRLPFPNYQRFSPALVRFNETPIDIYA